MSYLPQAGILDTVTDILKSGVKGAIDVYAQGEQAKGAASALQAQQAAAAAQQSGGMPSWLLPVALGAGALVLVMVLKKR